MFSSSDLPEERDSEFGSLIFTWLEVCNNLVIDLIHTNIAQNLSGVLWIVGMYWVENVNIS